MIQLFDIRRWVYMIGGILLLAIAVFGLMVLFGKGQVENYFQFLIWLIFAPVLLAIGYNHAFWFWYGLPVWIQILSILLIPFFVSASLRILFPKAKWIQSLQTAIFQTLIYAVTFPFRLFWRGGQFFFQRERRTQRLNPYRSVIGGGPPLQNERHEETHKGTILIKIMPNSNGNILARWQTILEANVCSPLEFYQMVENELIESELPDLQLLNVTRAESGWFSPRRTYLRIRYQRLYFDVSAFMGGRFLIVGWWFHQETQGIADLFSEIPILRFLLERTTRSATYYRVDYLEFVQRSVHDSILRVVDGLRGQNGLPLLSAEARIPVWEEVW